MTESVFADEATGVVLRNLGEPLELVSMGQTHGNLRLDSRFVKDVLDRFEGAELSWGPVDEHLQRHYGFQPALRNLFLLFALRLKGYRAVQEQSGAPVDIAELDNRPRSGLRLVRAPLLDPAAWSAALDLGSSLFGLPRPASLRVLSAQDAWAKQLREAGRERRQLLGRQRELLGQWVDPQAPRCLRLRAASERLVAVDDGSTDSYRLLTALVAAWPADSADPLRETVRGAGEQLAVLDRLDQNAVHQLRAGAGHSTLGPAAGEQMAALGSLLAADELLRPDTVLDWNQASRELVLAMLKPIEPPPPPDPIPVPPVVVDPTPIPPAIAAVTLIQDRSVSIDDNDLAAFARELVAGLKGQEGQLGRRLLVSVTVRAAPDSAESGG